MKNGKPAIKLSSIACPRVWIASCLLCLFSSASFAAFSGADKGTSSGQFLKLGAGARAAGMGEAYSSVADDASAIYWNPAALSRINGSSAMFMHAALLADISYEFLGYGQNFGRGFLGLGVQYLSMPAFHETDPLGFPTGTSFSPGDMSLALAYALPLNERYSVGLSGKYIRSEIDKTASTFAADLGVLAKPCSGRGKDLSLSLVVQNLGGSFKYEQKSDPLPLNVKLGSSLPVAKNWLIGLDVNFPLDNRAYAALGTEYRLNYDAETGFAGRLGFNSKTLGDIDGLSGISIGAGLNFRQSWLDYAFLPFGTIGMTHRISITIAFGKPEAVKVPKAGLETNKIAVKSVEIPVVSTPTAAAAIVQETINPKVKDLLKLLKDPDWQKRRGAAFDLGKMKAVEAVAPLLELLEDENEQVCGITASALGRIGDRRALAPLIERLEDESAYVRASAARALGYLGDKRAIKPLKSALKDRSAQVRKAAASALRILQANGTKK